jgi:glycine/D-amino acid oxidase-like deaminating enzyme/nitrite reductase/ring-hydroxylating ferredoxin subunit
MKPIPAKPVSYWVDSTPETAYPVLDHDVTVDVAVIGGGIAGVSTALFLKRAGLKVALVESRQIGHGATGYTTAKVTSQHGLIYDHLTKSFGTEGARLYGEANEAAISRMEQLIEEYGIECDWERLPAYVYAADDEEREKIVAEVAAAQAAALPASFEKRAPLPFPTTGAVKFTNQAQFHPLKYLQALATQIPGKGSYAFENSRVNDVDEHPQCVVKTASGQVTAGEVVVATHYPFLDRGGFFAKVHPDRSYALAAWITGELPEGMFISAGSPTESIRSFQTEEGRLLQVGGHGHTPGSGKPRESLAALAEFAERHWRVDSYPYWWAAQDPMPLDGVPYVGRLSPLTEHLWTATGFRKWGMTNGTVAAMILTDRLTGKENPRADLFDSERTKPAASIKRFLTENAKTGLHFVGDRLKAAKRLDELAAGEGGIVRAGGQTVAAYRDEHGKVHAVSPVCTHLGCHVGWNDLEKTWDCPCHGSRYDYHGRVIQGPAVKDLPKREV